MNLFVSLPCTYACGGPSSGVDEAGYVRSSRSALKRCILIARACSTSSHTQSRPALSIRCGSSPSRVVSTRLYRTSLGRESPGRPSTFPRRKTFWHFTATGRASCGSVLRCAPRCGCTEWVLKEQQCIEKVQKWAISHIQNLPTYVDGRVALMGDAAHAMSTHLAAGAGQAIEVSSLATKSHSMLESHESRRTLTFLDGS